MGPRTCAGTSYMNNQVKLCSTWDRYPVYTTVQDAKWQVQDSNTKKKRGWAGWRPISEDDKAKFRMKVTGTVGTEKGNNLEEIQKQIEVAAKAVDFSTRAMGHNAENQILDEVTNRENAAARSERTD